MTSANVSAHSDVVGGSTAGRLIGCPGHVKLAARLPRPRSSSYADEGTALHDAVADVLNGKYENDTDVIGQSYTVADRDGAATPLTALAVDLLYRTYKSGAAAFLAELADAAGRGDITAAETLLAAAAERAPEAYGETDVRLAAAAVVTPRGTDNPDEPWQAGDLVYLRVDSVYVITEKLFYEAIKPCLDYLDQLIARVEAEDGEELQFLIEQKVEMPGIPGAFGTADFIGWTSRRTVGLDWKFGAGVRVNPIGNKQLRYYLRAAWHSVPAAFCIAPGDAWTAVDMERPVELHIFQPRLYDASSDEPTFETVQVRELEEFRQQLIGAAAAAKGDNAPFNKGYWCKFCPAEVVCPLKLADADKVVEKFGALQRIAALSTEVAKGVAEPTVSDEDGNTVTVEDMVAIVNEFMPLVKSLESFADGISTAAHVLLEAGYELDCGFKLVMKKPGNRQYPDPEKASAALGRLGVPADERHVKTLKSPAQIEATVKPYLADGRIEKKQFERWLKTYVVTPPPSGTTIAPLSDKRPALRARPTINQELGAKLSALADERND